MEYGQNYDFHKINMTAYLRSKVLKYTMTKPEGTCFMVPMEVKQLCCILIIIK